jgi:tRNA G18 (ribose-2'-O)-methylase SpoU
LCVSYFVVELHFGVFRIRTIASFDPPELAPYRTLRRSAEHAAQGIFVAEGDKVVQRLLESHFTVQSLVLPEARLPEFQPLLARRPEDVAVYLADKKFLESLVGFEMFQGVLAVGKIPGQASLDDLLNQNPSPRLFAAVDGLTNAENIGLLVRNCVAFGVQALIVGETCSSPWLRRSVRNSMGTIFKISILEVGPSRSDDQTAQRAVPTLVEALRQLRAHGIRCIAAHPHTDRKILSQADFTGDCCVVFGSEGYGISAPVLAECDEAVLIPMAQEVDSLNVSTAAAVFLYEASRQRSKV